MEIVNKRKTVKTCWYNCPLYKEVGEVMTCGHPFFNDKGAYSGLIITHENSRTRIPEECPLRFESLKIVKIIELSK
jgi:hypothetical protein